MSPTPQLRSKKKSSATTSASEGLEDDEARQLQYDDAEVEDDPDLSEISDAPVNTPQNQHYSLNHQPITNGTPKPSPAVPSSSSQSKGR